MAEHSICSNCGNPLKEQWLVCKFCHQPRWKRILPYYFGGVSFLAITLFTLSRWDNAVFLCAGAIFGALGGIMLLIGGVATLRGLSVRKNPPAAPVGSAPPARPQVAVRTSDTPAPPGNYVMRPMVDRLGSFSYTVTDEDRIRKIIFNIQLANREPGWSELHLQPGRVERANIPDYTRETIDYLLDDHVPTHKMTLDKLFKEGTPKLRETIIRILGAMGTGNALYMLEAFAANDPLRVNEDERFNLTSGSSAPLSATWVMPLRELAREELQKARAR